MPAKPRWHADLDKIRLEAAALPAPFLDRQAFQKLFGLRRRQAQNLMSILGGYRAGTSVVIGRQELLLNLDGLAGERGSKTEATRKARVVEALDALRSHARPKRIEPPPVPRPGSALPEGARISAPGELTISFSTPEDLLGRVLGLAQSAAGDFAAFAAGLSSEEGGTNSGAGAHQVRAAHAAAGEFREA
jgi:hypothetical protein